MLKSLMWKLLGSRKCICVARHEKNFLVLGKYRQDKWFEAHRHLDQPELWSENNVD